MRRFIKENWGIIFICTLVLFTTCFAVMVFSESQAPTPFTSSGIVAIISALIGVILTVVVTNILLKRQSETEGEKDQNLKIFEKKQEVYHNFLDQLKNIIQDGKITIASFDDKKSDSSKDELKDLIFQIAYLKLHTDDKNVDAVFNSIVHIIQSMNDFESLKAQDRQKQVASHYADLSKDVFEITRMLKKDLYKKEDVKEVDANTINDLLRECDLFIDSEEFDRYEIQNFFWSELSDEFRRRGYNKVKEYDFSQDVNKYYARARGRHRWFGFDIPIYESNKYGEICFKVELENEYYFGIPLHKSDNGREDIQRIITNIDGYKPTEYWAGYRNPYKNRLDFWNLHSEQFGKIKNPKLRTQVIKEIADEIEADIKTFISNAKNSSL